MNIPVRFKAMAAREGRVRRQWALSAVHRRGVHRLKQTDEGWERSDELIVSTRMKENVFDEFG